MNFHISTPTWAPSLPKKRSPCNFPFTTVPLPTCKKGHHNSRWSHHRFVWPVLEVHLNCTVCTLLHPVPFTQHVFEVYPCRVSVLHSFLLLSRTPSCGDIIYRWSIHPLRDIWVVASLELLEIKPLWMFLYMSSWDICTLPILLKNPFLLEKTKAVWSGSKALIETN